MEIINYNLISLKCVLFAFFAGLGCLYPFLPLHMLDTGLTICDSRKISIIAPCVALLGPLIICPLADYFAGSNDSSYKPKSGRYLRVMIAITLILGAIFYLLLLSVPTVIRLKARKPDATFISDQNGGMVLQERCTEEKTCHEWSGNKAGNLILDNCRYVCRPIEEFQMKNISSTSPTMTTTITYPDESGSTEGEYNEDDDYIISDFGNPEQPGDYDSKETKKRRNTEPILIAPPHLCYKDQLGLTVCQVYTENSKNISIYVNLKSALNANDDTEAWCAYPLDGYFVGRISESTQNQLIKNNGDGDCQPVINCNIKDPYDSPNSVLADSQCVHIIGDPSKTFWSYLFIRSVADIFPTTALALLDSAVIIATRETSSGRGDVGRQFAWGTLGFSIFAPLVGFLNQDVMPESPSYLIGIILFAVFMCIAALICLFDNQMPISPPEWWWHTKCGMLALPMSAVRRYGAETGALILVLFLLGIFWSTLDSYLPWHVKELTGSPLLVGLTITMGALPAVPFLWHAEKIVDYCGHSNILITAFTFYIIRYTGMSVIETPWWTLLSEAFEIFTLALMWITAVLYLRHLVPRKFTVSGQGLAVIAHFCLGRFVGALLGGFVQAGSSIESFRLLDKSMAVAAVVIAILYFLTYHFYLKPKCAAPPASPPNTTLNVTQSMNGNGSYTPLRVYHNGKARKGQFRY